MHPHSGSKIRQREAPPSAGGAVQLKSAVSGGIYLEDKTFLSDFSIKRSQSLLGRDEKSTPSVPGIRRQRACLVSLGEEVKQTAPQIVQVLETSVRGQKEQGAVPVQAGADTR